jgi:hypothetical protein
MAERLQPPLYEGQRQQLLQIDPQGLCEAKERLYSSGALPSKLHNLLIEIPRLLQAGEGVQLEPGFQDVHHN